MTDIPAVEILWCKSLVKIVSTVNDNGPCCLLEISIGEWKHVILVVGHDVTGGPHSLIVLVLILEQC